MDIVEELMEKALEIGFSEAAPLDASTLTLMDEVRQMCAADKCRMYGKTWSCPPGCGSIEDMRARIAPFHRGFLVQTVGTLEDEFDYESMVETEKRHRKGFYALVPLVLERLPNALPMAAGACARCEKCTYPDAPCRFPKLAFPSMEACGLFVSDICRKNGMKYNYGKLTISFTSCVLTD